ncbi:neurofilament medium polypeptide [Nematolebias whitei]|uniref:neurofilament medium polypeptide n=1 Tax=Nematolebias whitei TaxID=451745 RepID=UPI001899A109|nr:neurofilament medium polypeptide [Nematolebias whitei]
MMLIKEEGPEEQTPDVDQQEMELVIVKEEEQELWTSVEGRQLDAEEETAVARFPLTAVSLKSEEDEEKPPQQHIEKRDLPTSSSADHMETETGGGQETTRNPGLKTHGDDSSSSETEVSDHDEDEDENHFDCQLKGSSDFETKTEDWKESESPGSGVNSVNKSFSCSECGQQFLHTWPLQRHMAVS